MSPPSNEIFKSKRAKIPSKYSNQSAVIISESSYNKQVFEEIPFKM